MTAPKRRSAVDPKQKAQDALDVALDVAQRRLDATEKKIAALKKQAGELLDTKYAQHPLLAEAKPGKRLRTLADWLEFWDLPDTNMSVSGGEFAGQVSVTATGREILRWAIALGTPVTVLDFPEAVHPWKAHTTAGTVRADGVELDVRVQWSQVLEDAPAGAA